MFKYTDGLWPNTLLLGYGLGAGMLAVSGLLSANGWANAMAVLLLAHVLIIAAYVVHDCMHNSLFKAPKHNRQLARPLLWLLGSGYTPYSVLQQKHIRHHSERMDVLAVDYRQWLQQHPVISRCVSGLQWVHIPAAELLTRWLSVAAPLYLEQRKAQRQRLALVLASRVLFFMLLYLMAPMLLLGYWLAMALMIWVLGFMDAYQHSYTVQMSLDDSRSATPFDADYEEQHTYSNLLCRRLPLINLLVLNFCYHNAHHRRVGMPWYQLPALHQQCYQPDADCVISFKQQLRDYHCYRQQRVKLPAEHDTVDAKTLGAAGVSFLVGV
jgi:fatty acid desaturase